MYFFEGLDLSKLLKAHLLREEPLTRLILRADLRYETLDPVIIGAVAHHQREGFLGEALSAGRGLCDHDGDLGGGGGGGEGGGIVVGEIGVFGEEEVGVSHEGGAGGVWEEGGEEGGHGSMR